MRRAMVLLMVCAGAWAQGRGGNLQVLKPAEVNAAMSMIVQGTGLTCEACHVGNDRASDDKLEKITARQMLAMTRNINDTSFGGRSVVTCFTCHRGAPRIPGSAAQ